MQSLASRDFLSRAFSVAGSFCSRRRRLITMMAVCALVCFSSAAFAQTADPIELMGVDVSEYVPTKAQVIAFVGAFFGLWAVGLVFWLLRKRTRAALTSN